MAANTTPIYPKTPRVAWGAAVTAANTATDGTGTVETIITAGTEGTRIDALRLMATGTNSSATVARFFSNNGAATTTAGNNSLLFEITLPAVTISQTAVTTPGGEIVKIFDPDNPLVLPGGYKLLMTLGTAASGGWKATVIGGDY